LQLPFAGGLRETIRSMPRRFWFPLRLLIVQALVAGLALAQEDPGAPVPPPDSPPDQVFDVWPGTPPGETGDVGKEIMLVERRRPFYQIANVTQPTVSVYLPEPSKATGAAVMVFPGGGLVRLAIEHEGYEIAEWLRDNGIAAFMVKYRVPPRGDNPRERWKAGVQDAQRAISLVRSRADEFKIDPDGIGAIGFSAGGEIGTWLAVQPERQYEAIDAVDRQPTRPAFMLNIYPGGLAFGRRGEEPRVREDILALLDERTPPMFFAHAFPDASMNSILMLAEMRKRMIPAELHIFQDGAHGFGRRSAGAPFAAWTDLALRWMDSLGFLDPPHVRAYPQMITTAIQSRQDEFPRITELEPKTTLEEAYDAQKRLVGSTFRGEKVIGYKGAASTAGAMKRFQMDAPLHCAIFDSAMPAGADANVIPTNDDKVIETEIGYIMGVDIPTRIEDASEAQSATQAVVAAIEVPTSLNIKMGTKLTAADFIASNCGGRTRIATGPENHPDQVDWSKVHVKLSRDGESLIDSNADATHGGQWENLRTLINQIVDQGRVIREGDIILSGAIGGPQAAKKGAYSADYGQLGKIELQLK